jgi:hypothetical protein
MTRPARPRRRALRAAAVLCILSALPALAPSAASADYASANTWGGGAAGPGSSAVTGDDFAARGALVSMVTSPTRARLFVSVRSDRCVVNGTLRGVVSVQPGGVGDLQALRVGARRTLTTKASTGRTRARVSVALVPGAPGLLVGTVEARGRVTLHGRTRACAMRERVSVRSRAALAAPAGPLSADPGASRTGIVDSVISPRVPGAVAITKRPDGSLHGFWSLHQTCVSGTKRSSDDFVNVGKRFRVRKDGSFRGREVFTRSARVKEGRSRFRFVATITGRIGDDGVARGRVTVRSRDELTGYIDLVCTVPSTPFAAAPVS